MVISSPLLDSGLEGAKHVLLNFTGDIDLTRSEINQAAEVVAQAASPETSISFGALIDPRLAHEMRITLIATGGRPPLQPHRGSSPQEA